jgi:hypothetical protein
LPTARCLLEASVPPTPRDPHPPPRRRRDTIPSPSSIPRSRRDRTRTRKLAPRLAKVWWTICAAHRRPKREPTTFDAIGTGLYIHAKFAVSQQASRCGHTSSGRPASWGDSTMAHTLDDTRSYWVPVRGRCSCRCRPSLLLRAFEWTAGTRPIAADPVRHSSGFLRKEHTRGNIHNVQSAAHLANVSSKSHDHRRH